MSSGKNEPTLVPPGAGASSRSHPLPQHPAVYVSTVSEGPQHEQQGAAGKTLSTGHLPVGARTSLTVPYVQQEDRTGSTISDRSTAVVNPSPSGSVRNFPVTSSRRASSIVQPFDQQQDNNGEPCENVYMTAGQASVLAKITRPFSEKTYQALQARIAERKKFDDEAKKKLELGEARLVDGNLIMEHGDKLEHDPKLADGRNLPKAVANNFPKNLMGLPIEDIDPRHREYDETFLIISRRFNKNGYIFRFSASKSMFIFPPWNPIRKLALYLYTHPFFDILIIFTILANSIFMAMNVDESTPEYTFLAIYTIEAIIKAIARGIILSPFTYLRDPWNWLDFVVLVSAYATIIAQTVTSGTKINIQALRTFRVFRVLKTIAIIPGLKSIIEALLRAFKNLGDVLIMTFFFFTIFALFGVQMYQGSLQTKCVLNADSVGVQFDPDSSPNGTRWRDWVSNSSNWFFTDDGTMFRICGNFSMARSCPINYTCILVVGSHNPNSNFTRFDDFIGAFLVAIQLFNTDYWDFLYNWVTCATGPSTLMFFLFAILFLNYYLANLVQAVVVLSYTVDEEDEDDEDANELVAAAKKSGRRFVFDPARLRIIKIGSNTRARSLQSVRSVTERRYGAEVVEVGNNAGGQNVSATVTTTNKPVAIVKPQAAGTISPMYAPSAIDSPYLSTNIKAVPTAWPSSENAVRYRVKSHPPSIVDEDDLPQIGYWDTNPLCCFKCCACLFPWLRFQYYIRLFVTDPFFDLFITATIVINTISMASRYDGMPDDVDAALDQLDSVCTYIFITEAALKLTAMCGEYFDNRWNWLDFLVVIGSIPDIVLSQVNVQSIGFNTSIIRLLRLLRILKLAQSWKTMRTLLEIIIGTFGAIGNLMLVLFIVMFIFAVIGMQLFSTSYTAPKFTSPGGIPGFTPFPGFTGVPEWNWNDFLHSFMLVFRVLCRETYQPMLDCATANSFAICTPFYLVMLFIGSYVVLNLFLAVLLNAFSGEDLKKKTADEEDSKLTKRLRAVRHWFKRQIAQCGRKKAAGNSVDPGTSDVPTTATLETEDTTVSEPEETTYYEQTSENGSKSKPTLKTEKTDVSTATPENKKVADCCAPCCEIRFPNCMSQFSNNTPNGARFVKFRSMCHKVTENKGFEFTILGFIFASSISLCLQDATLHDDSDLAIALNYMDYIYLGVFTVEMMFKLCGLGIYTYFTSFWTLLDAVIVITGYVDIIVGELGSNANLSALRALRTLRALRPLRAISRWQGMKIVVNALISAIPGIINVLLVVMLIWLIFAIMGVQFFAGKFWMCVDVATGNRMPVRLVPDKETCLANPNWQWSLNLINFDNVAYSYLSLFQVGTFEGWTTVMQFAIDAPDEKGKQPFPENNVNYYIYFLLFIILCSFFLLNLFVGVIIDDFNALKKKYEGSRILDLFMTDSQKNYYSTIKKLGLKKPRRTAGRPKDEFSIFFYDVSISTRMEFAVAGIIGANVIIMATEHFDQAVDFTVAQELFNVTFTVVFALEAIVKLIGLRIHYFRSAWNVFDFTIVIVSILSIALADLFAAIHVSPSMLRVLRVLRVGRVVRIVRTSKGVRKLMFSLMMSLPALFNIGCLLFLVIFIYAIIGMNLFGHIGHYGGNLDDVTNFHTFPYALLTLFRLSTVAGWDNIHQGLSFTDDLKSGCNPNVDISDPKYPQSNPCCNRTAWLRPNGELVYDDGGWGNCGNFSLATVYVISYLLFTYFIVVNMFAAVILDFYQDATNQDEIGVTDEDIERFYIVWEQYDPLATQFIKLEDLTNFLAALGAPLGCAKPNDSAITVLDFPILRDSQTGDEVVHCVDILMGLVRKALGSIDETDEFKMVKSHLESVVKHTFPSRLKTEKVSTTKWRKKQEVAAKTIQRRWRHFQAIRDMQHKNRETKRLTLPYQEAYKPAKPPTSRASNLGTITAKTKKD